MVDRKYFVTALRHCANCKLLFRTPTTTSDENRSFYQKEYSQGFTTDMPSDDRLHSLIEVGFKGTEKDYSSYLAVLHALGCKKRERLLDFGCSWGYGSWQLKNSGYLVKAFEISEDRCNYAKQYLDIDAYSTLAEIVGPFDVFFSAHALEHVPSVSQAIAYAWQVIRPGGLFVAFTPNGSRAYRASNPTGWHKLWGLVHSNMLDEVYYNKVFENFPRLMASRPYPLEKLNEWKPTENKCEMYDLSGGELLLAVRKPK